MCVCVRVSACIIMHIQYLKAARHLGVASPDHSGRASHHSADLSEAVRTPPGCTIDLKHQH